MLELLSVGADIVGLFAGTYCLYSCCTRNCRLATSASLAWKACLRAAALGVSSVNTVWKSLKRYGVVAYRKVRERIRSGKSQDSEPTH